MSRFAALALVALLGCGTDGPEHVDALAGDDAAADASRDVDARGAGIDGPPGPCPFVPASPPVPAVAGPSGTYRVAWRCISGCTAAPPALVGSTHVDILAGGLRWRSGAAAIATHATEDTSNCRRALADDGDCRAFYDLCGTSGVRADVVSWYDVNTQWRQSWEVSGMR